MASGPAHENVLWHWRSGTGGRGWNGCRKLTASRLLQPRGRQRAERSPDFFQVTSRLPLKNWNYRAELGVWQLIYHLFVQQGTLIISCGSVRLHKSAYVPADHVNPSRHLGPCYHKRKQEVCSCSSQFGHTVKVDLNCYCHTLLVTLKHILVANLGKQPMSMLACNNYSFNLNFYNAIEWTKAHLKTDQLHIQIPALPSLTLTSTSAVIPLVSLRQPCYLISRELLLLWRRQPRLWPAAGHLISPSVCLSVGSVLCQCWD